MRPTIPFVAATCALAVAGVIAAGPSAPWLPHLDVSAIQLTTAGEDTSATLTDLLNTASTNYAEAYSVADEMVTSGLVPIGNSDLYQNEVGQAEFFAQTFGQIVADLSRDQSALDAKAGALSGLLDQFWFAPLDQEEVSFSAALLQATQALDTAVQNYDAAATPGNTLALDAAEQTINALGWEQILLDGQTNLVFEVANVFANPAF